MTTMLCAGTVTNYTEPRSPPMTVPSQSFKDHTTSKGEVAIARHCYEMNAPVKQVYREILKLVKRLPPASRGYYTQYARENFITYSEVQDQATVWSLLERAHHHSCWILNKVTPPQLTILVLLH